MSRDDVAAGLVGCTSKQSVSQCVKPLRLGVDISLPTGRHAERDYFTLREGEADHYAKTTGRNPESIFMGNYEVNLPISMGNSAQCVSNARATAEYKCLKVIKPSNPFTNVCWVLFLTTFSAPPQILCIDSFLLPNSRNEEMIGDGFLWCYCCGLF